jgi:hypothetical protein
VSNTVDTVLLKRLRLRRAGNIGRMMKQKSKEVLINDHAHLGQKIVHKISHGNWLWIYTATWNWYSTYEYTYMRIPSELCQAVKLLTCIPEVPGSNLCQDTDYPDWRFSWFSSVCPCRCWDSTSNYATSISFQILSNSLFTNDPPIRRYIINVIDSFDK